MYALACATDFKTRIPPLVLGCRLSRAILWKLSLGLAVLLTLWIAHRPLFQLLAVIKDREAIVSQVHSYGAWGPLSLGALIAFQVTVAVIPGHVLMLAGGYLYGFGTGFLITWVATVAASQINFLLARRAGRALVYRLAPASVLERWHAVAEGKGFTFFLMVFILPIFPSDLMAYVAGFTKISPRRFLAANVFGHLPCATVMSLVGSGALVVAPEAWAWVVVLCVGVLLLWRLYGNRFEGRFSPRAQEA